MSVERKPGDPPISTKAFAVLLHLAEHPGRLLTKQALLDAVWPETHVGEGVLKRYVLEIRRALGDDAAEPRYIQTLHRRGYRFLQAEEPEPVVQEPKRRAAPPADCWPDPRIIGRKREFEQLDSWFGKALESDRQIVFITGEAGLGKSTLVASWMKSASGRRPWPDLAVARGRCLQQFGNGEPYLPIFEVLEQLSRVVGATSGPVTSHARPHVAAAYAGSDLSRRPPPAS